LTGYGSLLSGEACVPARQDPSDDEPPTRPCRALAPRLVRA